MWRAGKGYWSCSVTERLRNAERVRIGIESNFVGRSHQFGMSKENVKAFIKSAREEKHGSDE